jgi:transposase
MKERYLGKELSHEVLEIYRFRALELRKKGKRVKDIAEFFGVHPNSVSRWFIIKKTKGKSALKSKKALGPATKLRQKDVKNLLQKLKKPATDFGFETPLWTCKRLGFLIQKMTKKKLHNSNVWKLLRRLNITNQTPERRAMQQNPKEAKRWLREEWPKIQAHARRWQAMLYFQDESGISLIPNLGKTWAPRGKTPIVKVTGARGGFCVTSAISPAGRLIFRLEKGKINADKHIEFLEQVRNQHKNRKVIIVEDKAPVHTAAKVAQFVEQHKKSFALYYLPSYSPELNPDENVWGYLKGKKLSAHQAKTTPELRKITLGAMRSMQKQPDLVQSFFYNLT